MVVKLTFWIVCAVFICYSVGLVQEARQHLSTSNVNTTLSAKHFRSRKTTPESGRQIESWEEENDTDLPTDNGVTDNGVTDSGVTDSGGIIHNSDAKSNQSDEKFRVKRASEKAPFRCLAIKGVPSTNLGGLNVRHCVQTCWIRRKALALLKKKNLCSCTNNDDMYESVDVSNCDTRCKDTKTQNCGGDHHFSEYKTGYIKEPEFNKFTEKQIQKAKIGCITMIKKAHLTAINRFLSVRLTPPMCIEYCIYHRFKFAALTNKKNCRCFNDIKGIFAKTGKEKCNAPCFGDPKWMCGGHFSLTSNYKYPYDIYRTGFREDQKQTNDQRFDDLKWKTPQIDYKKIAFFEPIKKIENKNFKIIGGMRIDYPEYATIKYGNKKNKIKKNKIKNNKIKESKSKKKDKSKLTKNKKTEKNGKNKVRAFAQKGPVALLLVNILAFYCIVL